MSGYRPSFYRYTITIFRKHFMRIEERKLAHGHHRNGSLESTPPLTPAAAPPLQSFGIPSTKKNLKRPSVTITDTGERQVQEPCGQPI